MTNGGARLRSGPRADEKSARSDRRGYRLDALPAAGYDGEVPDWPLPEGTARELEVWQASWRLPQGCAWATPGQEWRQRHVAMWVRVAVRCEAPDSKAALLAQLHRLADLIGMSDAGLAAMGWKVATQAPEVAAAPSEPPQPQRRLRALPDGGAAS